MDKILFADGTEKDCSFCATNPVEQKAMIAITNVDLAEAVAIFSDETKTRNMVFNSNRMVGYTELLALFFQSYGIQATLRGGHDEIVMEEED